MATRKDIINYCNENIFTQVDPLAWIGYKGELMEVVKTVTKWRAKNGYPALENMIARVNDGFLYINEKPVERIAPKMPRITDTAGAAYWENRILARQEM